MTSKKSTKPNMRGGTKAGKGFTLVELLVVIAVIAILASVLYPVIANAKLKAKVARVHSDLRQISLAIEMYNADFRGLPPVRSTCSGTSQWNYYEFPKELVQMRYISSMRMHDPFNRTIGGDRQILRPYKYIAINWGYTGNNKGWFSMWIPRDYPKSAEKCCLYYKQGGKFYAFDRGKSYPKEPPVVWAVWSVGPGGDPGMQESSAKMHPVPKSEWYPYNQDGVIVRLSDGRSSP